MQKRLWLVILTTLILTGTIGHSQTNRELVVGTKPTVPFVIKTPAGDWQGISIELWQTIADSLGLTYRFEETDLEGLQAGLENGTLDVAAAALTVTAERESRLDFTHPFYTTGLTIAVSASGNGGILSIIEQLFSADFLSAIGALLAVLVLIGIIVWIFERKRNAEEFGGSFLEGIGSGVWWSAVTMTTVGYGDKAPRTFLGRIVGLVWMFAAIIVVSGFTAAITSSLTVSQLSSKVRGPADLPYVSVGSIANSTSAGYLDEEGITFTSYDTPLAGLQAVSRGDIEAFVYDAPILKYLIKTQLGGRVQVLPVTFYRQDYAFALPQDSELREPINQVLLEHLQQAAWSKLLTEYMGD